MKSLIPFKSTAIIFISLLLVFTAGGISCSTDTATEEDPDIRRMQKSFQPDFLTRQAKKVFEFAEAHQQERTGLDYIEYAIAGQFTSRADRNWIRATKFTGVMDMYHATRDPFYLEKAIEWAEKHEWQVGTEESGLNLLFSSNTWVDLYLLDPQPERIEPTITWLESDAPNSPGGGAEIWFGHGPAPYDYPVYADALFGTPVFPMLYRATGDKKWLDIFHHVFSTTRRMVFNEEYGLFYRDTRYINAVSPNGKKIFWSRGNGWVFGALPRNFRHLPDDFVHLDEYKDLYRKMAAALAERQQDDGFWRANLADPFHTIMPESSGTAFFLRGFAWGIHAGILDRETYLPVVIRGWKALLDATHENGLFGWVQPVDEFPRPSHPEITHEYAVGLYLAAVSELLQLMEKQPVTLQEIAQALPKQTHMLPPQAFRSGHLTIRDHPLFERMNNFSVAQHSKEIEPTGLDRQDYIRIIAGQVKAFFPLQNEEGRIIDPAEEKRDNGNGTQRVHTHGTMIIDQTAGKEYYYSTPCYAHSVAALVKAGYPLDQKIVESGMKALDVALADMAAAQAPDAHGDFFTWPLVFAIEGFENVATQNRKEHWQSLLAQIEPSKAYFKYEPPIDPTNRTDFYHRYRPGWTNNWNLKNTAGEFVRHQHVNQGLKYVDDMLTLHLANFNDFGMFNENGNPFAYDLFARLGVVGMLQRGYDSFLHGSYRDLMWRGAWTSLFMQSPFGELPTGFRSSHHIWNEAQQAVVFEIYASAYAEAGLMEQAGAFKRAARLALSSVADWIRPDGSGYIVKNRFPAETRWGYDAYSRHTTYNLLATSMLAQAWLFANEDIPEKPSPADVGGFVFEIPAFRKIFANANGNHIIYDTRGDHIYNPTGLIRIHLRKGNPQLGPSDGTAKNRTAFALGGYFLDITEARNRAVGPMWKDNSGQWHALADLHGSHKMTIIEQNPRKASFRIEYPGNTTVIQYITITPEGVVVEDRVEGDAVQQVRSVFPALIFDGEQDVKREMTENGFTLSLRGATHEIRILNEDKAIITPEGIILANNNGRIEPILIEIPGSKSIRYMISAKAK